MTEAKVGMRVMVYEVDGTPNPGKPMGLGTITKVEPLDIEFDDGHIERLMEDYPAEITLDDGRKTEGMECWWHPVDNT